jgi:hypothetical protein
MRQAVRFSRGLDDRAASAEFSVLIVLQPFEYRETFPTQATLSASAKLPPMILRISASEKVPLSSEA